MEAPSAPPTGMRTEDGTKEMLDLIPAPDSREWTHFNINGGECTLYITQHTLLRDHIMLDIEECKENHQLIICERYCFLLNPSDMNQKASFICVFIFHSQILGLINMESSIFSYTVHIFNYISSEMNEEMK